MNFQQFSKFVEKAVKPFQKATNMSVHESFSTKNITSNEIFNHSCFEKNSNCYFQLL